MDNINWIEVADELGRRSDKLLSEANGSFFAFGRDVARVSAALVLHALSMAIYSGIRK